MVEVAAWSGTSEISCAMRKGVNGFVDHSMAQTHEPPTSFNAVDPVASTQTIWKNEMSREQSIEFAW